MTAANKRILQDLVSSELNYEIWSELMKSTLKEKKLWDVVKYGIPPDPSKIPDLASKIQLEDLSNHRHFVRKDTKALQFLQSSLPDSVFRQTVSIASSKDLWELLKQGNEQAKLEQEFEEIRMEEGERVLVYIDRVMKIAQQIPLLADSNSEFIVISKILTSLPASFTNAVLVVEQLMGLKKLTFDSLRQVLDLFESVSTVSFHDSLKDLLVKSSSFERDPNCFQYGEKVYYSNVMNYLINEYVMFALGSSSPRCDGMTFDEDMWMIHTTTTNHMTPYDKYLTNFSAISRSSVKFANGDIIIAEGIGDLMIITKSGMKTIKNVLYVPVLDRNVLSVPQMTKSGYVISIGRDKCIIKDRTGKLFAKAKRHEKGGFYMKRLKF